MKLCKTDGAAIRLARSKSGKGECALPEKVTPHFDPCRKEAGKVCAKMTEHHTPSKEVVYGKVEFEVIVNDLGETEVKRKLLDKSTRDVPREFPLPSDRKGPIDLLRITPPGVPCKMPVMFRCGALCAVGRLGKRIARFPGEECPVSSLQCAETTLRCKRLVLAPKVRVVNIGTRVSRSNWVDQSTLQPQSTPGFGACFDNSLVQGESLVKQGVNARDAKAFEGRNPGKAPWGRNPIGERVIDSRPTPETGSWPRRIRK